MEGCPRLLCISFDLKTSIEHVNLCEKIPQFISANYHENADQYRNECDQINRLRQNAVNAPMDDAGLAILKRYYCQLLLLRNRFPMYCEGECAVKYTWEDAFQKEDNTMNDIRFEEASILYNIGAMYSRLAANETRRTPESAKTACTDFRYAAGCFEKVRDQYIAYTSDFTPDLLNCQIYILLGQAHETVLEKALLDQRPSAILTQIAMQISEYNQMASLNLTRPGLSSIASKRYREWRVILTYKLSYYLALSYYFSGVVAEEAKKRGQAVCYYEAAVERLKEAWKNAEKISSDKTAIFKDVQQFTSDVLTGKFKAAKRDNDSVYFEKVPSLASLPAIQGVIVAKPQFFDCHDPDVCGPDIFQKLVPLDAHLAASEYSEEKAKLLREVIELTEDRNRELETYLRCLQLDRVPLNNEYLRLPRELLDCCAAAATRPNLIKDLVSAMQQLNSQHHDVTEQVTDLQEALQTFDEMQPGNKEAKEMQMNLKAILEMMNQAHESNVELHRRMSTIMEHIKILHGPLEQLEKNLPIIHELDDENNKPKFAQLALLNEKIETMRKQRDMLVNEFRRKVMDDDITKLVLMQRQDNHKTLFTDQVKKHEEIVNTIKQNCLAQDNILQALTDANAEIADLRMKMASTFENRNRMIQEYINSFKEFETTLAKANEGIDFYKKQSAKLNKFKERLTTLQAQQTVSKPAPPPIPRPISSNVPSRFNPPPEFNTEHFSLPELPPSNIPDRPRLKDYLAAMKPDSWGSSTTTRASKRSSTKLEETMYIPPAPTSSLPVDGNPLYSARSSIPSFPQQISSPMHSDPPAMSYNFVPPQVNAFPPTRVPTSPDTNMNRSNPPPLQYPQSFYPPPPPPSQPQQQFYSPSMNQQPHYPAPPTSSQQPQQHYSLQSNVPLPQQPQHHYSQQPTISSAPSQQQQQHYSGQSNGVAPHPPQQQYAPQTNMPLPQQPIYQPPVISPTPYQTPSMPAQPPMQYQQPAYSQPTTYQPAPAPVQPTTNVSEQNRSNGVAPAPLKYDPYRPQPLGAYDIPKSSIPAPTLGPVPPASATPGSMPVVSSTPNGLVPSPLLTPQDIYRPGGLLANMPPVLPHQSMNNNHYVPIQQPQHPPVPGPTAAPPPVKTSTINIADDLLSLALEEQAGIISTKVEPLIPQTCFSGQYDRR